MIWRCCASHCFRYSLGLWRWLMLSSKATTSNYRHFKSSQENEVCKTPDGPTRTNLLHDILPQTINARGLGGEFQRRRGCDSRVVQEQESQTKKTQPSGRVTARCHLRDWPINDVGYKPLSLCTYTSYWIQLSIKHISQIGPLFLLGEGVKRMDNYVSINSCTRLERDDLSINEVSVTSA